MDPTHNAKPRFVDYARIFLRGFTIVTLTAMNTSQIAQHDWFPAFVVGYLISAVWWSNAHSAGVTELPHAGPVYAFGAACGTVFGMLLAEAIRFVRS